MSGGAAPPFAVLVRRLRFVDCSARAVYVNRIAADFAFRQLEFQSVRRTSAGADGGAVALVSTATSGNDVIF